MVTLPRQRICHQAPYEALTQHATMGEKCRGFAAATREIIAVSLETDAIALATAAVATRMRNR